VRTQRLYIRPQICHFPLSHHPLPTSQSYTPAPHHHPHQRHTSHHSSLSRPCLLYVDSFVSTVFLSSVSPHINKSLFTIHLPLLCLHISNKKSHIFLIFLKGDFIPVMFMNSIFKQYKKYHIRRTTARGIFIR